MGREIPGRLIRLLLVRHGQTEWNSNGRFMGQMDIPLDGTGLRQVQAVAHRLRVEQPAIIYTSDLQRALHTAKYIQTAIADYRQAPPPPLASDARLREMYFGNWEGLTYSEIQSSQPLQLKAWEADLLNFRPPGGENLRQMGERVSEFLDEIMLAHPGETVMLVAHGGTFEALAMVHLGFKTDKVWQLRMSNTGISEFSCYPAGATLDRWNDTGHLEGLA